MSAKHPEQIPRQLVFEEFEAESSPSRLFDPDQRRAFGSLPGLVGHNLDIPPFEHLDTQAFRRSDPAVLRRGLYGVRGGYSVERLALTAEEYTVLVRSPQAFQSQTGAKTLAANRQSDPLRAQEKELRSMHHALSLKADKHRQVLTGLSKEREPLAKLSQWQQTPGYARTTELDMRMLGTAVWEGSFRHIIRSLADQHRLAPTDVHNLTDAIAYRLYRGPQQDRVAYSGDLLRLGLGYNQQVTRLFSGRYQILVRDIESLDEKIANFYQQHGILPPH